MRRALVIVVVLLESVCVLLGQAPQAPQRGRGAPQAAPADAGRGGGGRGNTNPRILSFDANPTSIKPGESFVLSWSTENGPVTINNGIGAVALRGTIRVTPKTTATYTLSMANGSVTKSVTVTVAGTTPSTATDQPTGEKPIPRIDGKPNFTGVYNTFSFYNDGGGAGGGRGGRGGGAAAPAQVPASPYSNLPGQPVLKAGVANRGGGGNPAGGTADCMPLPADTAFGVPYPFQIIQSKDYVVLLHEYPGTFRIIPLDGQPHQVDPDPTWMGDSTGHWDGDTLVIDTVGFNGKHAIGTIQQPSEKFHTIERLTRTSAGLYYEIIFEDPEFATGQWRTARAYNQDARPGVNKIMEFVCENNRNYVPLFGPEGPAAGRGGGRGNN